MTIKMRTIIILKDITPFGSGKGGREAWRSRIAIQTQLLACPQPPGLNPY